MIFQCSTHIVVSHPSSSFAEIPSSFYTTNIVLGPVAKLFLGAGHCLAKLGGHQRRKAKQTLQLTSVLLQDQHHGTALAKPKLFALPAELRNQIYILILKELQEGEDEDGEEAANNNASGGEGGGVCVTYGDALDSIEVGANTKLPGLLRTCRVIRAEAKGIWYNVNDFHFEVNECDASLLIKFERHLKAVGYPQAAVTSFPNGKDWINLVEWSRPIWQGDCRPLSEYPCYPFEEDDEEDTVITAAHGIAVQFRGHSHQDFERALGHLKPVVAMLGVEWVKKEHKE